MGYLSCLSKDARKLYSYQILKKGKCEKKTTFNFAHSAAFTLTGLGLIIQFLKKICQG